MIRVLIVDDDNLALTGLRTMIPWAEHGIEIVGEAANGQKALDFLKETPVDLVMVDLAMPVMDGLTFIRECQKLYPKIRYVVMTFHETFEYVQEALRLGVIDYISKLKLESENYDSVFLRIKEKMEAVPDDEKKKRGGGTLRRISTRTLRISFANLFGFATICAWNSCLKISMPTRFLQESWRCWLRSASCGLKCKSVFAMF